MIWGSLQLAKQTTVCFVVSVAFAVAIPFMMGGFGVWPAIGVFLAFWVFLLAGYLAWHDSRYAGSFLAGLRRQSSAWWGMQLAHVGLGVTVLGITMVMGYQAERDVRMLPGDVVTVRSTTFRFNGVSESRGPNYLSKKADMSVIENGVETGHLYPEKRDYFSSRGMPMTEAAIRHGITGDVYVSLGNPTSDGGWVVRAYSKPFVLFIWIGTLLMALGGVFAMSDRRYRRHGNTPAADKGVETP